MPPPGQSPQPFLNANRLWLGAALFLVAIKLWLVSGQTIYAIGGAIHDDKLFLQLAEHLINGQWLGPYDQFTLAKGPFYSFFIAANFWIGLPIIISHQLFYLGACVALTASFRPWLRSAAARFSFFVVLVLNPMSWDASNLTRLLRQCIYVPLGMLVIAGLVMLFNRRRDAWPRIAVAGAAIGLSYSAFWLTREESIWLAPVIALCWGGVLLSIRHEWRSRWRAHAAAIGCFLAAFALPILAVSWQNYRHYGWFGTVEFRADEFKDAYGALTRIKVGPEDLYQVPVSRQMREAAYELSPTFALLKPYLEGEIGDTWADREYFSAEERQMRAGWFMWALRDAHVAAGLAPDAATAMRHYGQIAAEINAACDSGLCPSRPPRSGFFPRLTRADITPIWQTTREYIVYFFTFRGFTAWSPDSFGDYADLKPFRDYTSNRLSYAPRSPMPPPPNQAELQRTQINILEHVGLFIANLIAWVGPLILLAGLARAIQCVLRKRFPWLLWLAGSLLVGVCAYLAINILITVTSFHNVSPGAMAGAYPLYLVALFAIAADAIPAWSRDFLPTPVRATVPLPSRWRWLVPAGAALVVWAFRLGEIHRFGGDVPFNDQWIVEALQIIQPWLDGTLRPWAFFLPHFEHVPVWTRLLAWIEVVLAGRWDPLLQMTVNTTFYAAFVWLVSRWAWRTFAPISAGLATAILVLGGALPHAWENIAWGFQSQFPLALLFGWWHLHDSLTHPAGSRRWWIAQAAGLAGLFTLASMWIAPLAVVFVHFWTRRQAPPIAWRVPAGLATAGLLLLAGLRFFGENAFAQNSATLTDFVHSTVHLLSWPSGLPGVGALLLLPWMLHAMRLRAAQQSNAADALIFALGLFGVLHAIGLAFARSGDTGDYVSRYGDMLFVGILAGAFALIRLVPIASERRTTWFILTCLWGALVTGGLWERATTGHAAYFHQTAADNAHIRRVAIQDYLNNGDIAQLEKGGTRWVLTQSTDVVRSLLDRSDFRTLLPASVYAANQDNLIGRSLRTLLSHWPWVLGAGLLVFCTGLTVIYWRGGIRSPEPLPDSPVAWRIRLGVITATVGVGGFLLWSQPVFSDPEARWHRLLGGDNAIVGMTFAFAQPAEFPDSRIQGAAPIGPIELRNRLFGTSPAGPALTCTIFSSPFTVAKDWLIIPYAGYPVGVGNGLRVQLLSADGSSVEREIECLPSNIDGLGYTTVDLKAVRGRLVRLVLYDGRVDTEAWVAVAPPILTDSPELATTLARQLDFEQHSSLPIALLVIGLISAAGTVFAIRGSRR